MYRVKPNICKCHVETCNCPPYKVYYNDVYICSGDNYGKLSKMITRANKQVKDEKLGGKRV